MKDQLALLRELQNIDLELDVLTSQKKVLQDRLEENRELHRGLVLDLETQKGELDEIKTLQSEKEKDLKEIQDNLKERKKRLLNVGSTKEYNAVEKEIEVLQKSQEQTEEELLRLVEVIESTEASIETKTGMTKELEKKLKEEESNSADELGGLDKKIAALGTRTSKARSEVSKRVLYKYDFIRSRRPGLAIVAAQEGHCTGCFMALPPQLFIQVQRAETLETCPSCQRILYFGVEELEAAGA